MLKDIVEKFQVSKKSFIIFAVCVSLVLYFLLYTIFGHRGVVDYFALKKELKEKNLVKDQLAGKIEDQQNLVKRMGNQSLDTDLLDEQVRKNLGYAKNDEIIIFDKDKK